MPYQRIFTCRYPKAKIKSDFRQFEARLPKVIWTHFHFSIRLVSNQIKIFSQNSIAKTNAETHAFTHCFLSVAFAIEKKLAKILRSVLFCLSGKIVFSLVTRFTLCFCALFGGPNLRFFVCKIHSETISVHAVVRFPFIIAD